MKKIISFLLVLIFLFSVSACSIYFGNNNTSQLDSQNNSGASVEASSQNKDSETSSSKVQYRPTLDMLYSLTENSAMALVEIKNIGDVVYDNRSIGSDSALILEVEVINDYYQKFPQGTILQIPVHLYELDCEENENRFVYESGDGYDKVTILREAIVLDSEKLADFLGEYSRAIVYLNILHETYEWYLSKEQDIRVDLYNTPQFFYLNTGFIPIAEDNTIPFDDVYTFLKENNCGLSRIDDGDYYKFSSFLYHGMPLEELEENIIELYEQQLSE